MCDIHSSVLGPSAIDELLRRSKTKKTHIGNAYKTLNIYCVLPIGVCIATGNCYILQKAQWTSYPPSEEEILEAVDYVCTDSGKGGYVSNFDVLHYPNIVEYFAKTGLQYRTLEIIPTPHGTQCVSLCVPMQTQQFLSESGILCTRLTGTHENLQRVATFLGQYGFKQPSFRTNEILFGTAFWKYNKQSVYKIHHALLNKVIRGEFQVSITEYMKYVNFTKEERSYYANQLYDNLNVHTPEKIEQFLHSTNWANVLLQYCDEQNPLENSVFYK